ncbi:MAG: HEPN domain-containing protein [Armatimonadota bacterium]|nr:HEPN domain-containing protein [Armatimonadota bacterium]
MLNDGYVTDSSRKTARQKPPLILRCETEFEALMEEIDAQLSEEKVAITARPIMAGLKITERYDIELPLCPPRRAPKSNCFDSIETSIRLNAWFERRYGERLNVPFAIGRVAFPFRGAFYAVNCPTTYGTVAFICDPQTFGMHRPTVGVNRPPIVNILDMVEGMTPHMVQSVKAEEGIKLGAAMTQGIATFSVLRALEDVPLVPEVLGDLDAAVMHLVAIESHPGLSKWASLQACEKMVKAFLRQKGQVVKNSHNLDKLFKHAVNQGVPQPSSHYLDAVRCLPDVRYGRIPVKPLEANLSHLVSLELCEAVGRAIGKVLKRSLPIVSEPQVDGIPMRQFLAQQGVRLDGPFNIP